MTPSQNLPKNVGELGKLIVAKDFKKLPKVQKITKSGHTAAIPPLEQSMDLFLSNLLQHLEAHLIPLPPSSIVNCNFNDYNFSLQYSLFAIVSDRPRHIKITHVHKDYQLNACYSGQ